ncbi:hypothetical protein HY024_01025 [Candidatus Curtissbacteria bacterium]|nr:hypothetical protein [Candidatus Curtissbacteria bacterium]
MQDPNIHKKVLTSLIKKQMMLLGPQVALTKVQSIDGLKVAKDGTVTSITRNPDDIVEEIFSLFMDFPARIAAKEIITSEATEAKEVKNQIAGGWLQMENEKAHLVSAIEGIPFGFITTNEALEITNKNGMVEKILGISEDSKKGWSVNEIQQHLKDQFYLPIECNKSMESRLPINPVDVNFDQKRLRFFVSPIISIAKQAEVSGVTIIIQYLGAAVPSQAPPAAPSVPPAAT